MENNLRIILVEDSEIDAEMISGWLESAGYIIYYKRVDTLIEMKVALSENLWDLILFGNNLMQFDAEDALLCYHESEFDIPFFIVSNAIGDETATVLMAAGAHDYFNKDQLARLSPAVVRELNSAKIRKEKKQTQLALDAAEKRYHSLFEHDTTGNYFSTLDGKLIDCNPAFVGMLGYDSVEELSKMSMGTLFVDHTACETIVARLRADKNLEGIEHEMIRKDGRRIVCIENISGIFGDDGQLNHFLGYLVDITEQKLSENALKESEARYQILFSEMMEGFALYEIICNKKGKPIDYRFLSVNPAFERMTGQSAASLINKTVKEVLPDTETLWIERYGAVALTSIPVSFEDYSKSLDRNYQVVAFCPQNGQFATIITDITDRKKAEKLLVKNRARLIRGESVSKSGNWELHLDSGIIIASEGARKLYGIEGEQWRFNTIKDFVLPAYRDSLDNALEKLIRNGTSYDVEFKINQQHTGQILDMHSIAEYDTNDRILFGVIQDITDRKKVESELISREQKYRELANSLPVSVFETNLAGNIIFANATAYEWFGYEGQELISDFNFLHFFQESDRPKAKSHFNKVLSKDAHVSCECKAKRKDGSIFPVLSSSFAIQKDGLSIGIRGTLVDISDRKKTELKLEKSERTLSNLISNLPGFVYRCKNDTGWTMEYLSEGFTMVSGYAIEDIIEVKKLTFNDIIHPDYRDYLWRQWQNVLALKTSLEEEYPILTKSGEIKWVWERGRGFFDEDGELLYLEGFITDITERKRTEMIQQVLYNISTAVLTTQNLEELIEIIRNQLGKLLDTSNFYVAFYDEATGMLSTPHAVDEKDELASWPAGKSLTGYLMKQKKALLIPEREYYRLIESGQVEIVGTPAKLWLGVPLQQEGKIIGAFVVQSYNNPNAYNSNDVEMLEFISHQISLFVLRKRAEGELRLALTKAEESDRLKSAFLATMNHELRTPLNHILGFSELIQSGVMQEDNQSFAASIYSSGKNLLALIEDVFDLALADQGNVRLRLQTFLLMDHFMENKSSFDQILQSSGKADNIKLVFKPDNRLLSMYLTVDRSKVNQVLINLFKNAVKFTNSGTIEFGYKSNEQGKLTFYIKDTGIGIPKEKQSIIFDFFRQGDDSPTRVYGGVGIGLAISLKIAKILKGELSVSSESGKGSAFYLTVPVELADVRNGLKFTEIH